MILAARTRDPRLIAQVAGSVVIADFAFTAPDGVFQPVTGVLLAHKLGWPLTEPWLVLSLALYMVAGVFWLPFVWI